MNVAIILAAGNSSRFNSDYPKQLYPFEGKPLIDWSYEILKKFFDKVVIVSNSECYVEMSKRTQVVVNDHNTRIESIKRGLDYIENINWDNILIHDVARPFIKEWHVEKLLESSREFTHSQYYLELVNGLVKRSDYGWAVAPREDFIELCTPQITNFKIFKQLFENYIITGSDCEILPLVGKLNLPYNLIKGNLLELRKITTIYDL